MRLFLAIEPPAAWRAAAARAAASLAARCPDSLRPVRPELLHLTLRFLGETGEERAAALRAALREAFPAAPPAVAPPAAGPPAAGPVAVALELAAAGAFGPPARTSVVWLGVGGDLAALRALAARADAAAAAAGLPAGPGGGRSEPRPHLTVARVRRRAGPAERRAVAAAARALAAPPPAPFTARGLALVRSRPGPDGPRYEALERYPPRPAAGGGGG